MNFYYLNTIDICFYIALRLYGLFYDSHLMILNKKVRYRFWISYYYSSKVKTEGLWYESLFLCKKILNPSKNMFLFSIEEIVLQGESGFNLKLANLYFSIAEVSLYNWLPAVALTSRGIVSEGEGKVRKIRIL